MLTRDTNILTTCWEYYSGADHVVTFAKLWLLLTANGGERRFLGRVSDLGKQAALAAAREVAPGGALEVRWVR